MSDVGTGLYHVNSRRNDGVIQGDLRIGNPLSYLTIDANGAIDGDLRIGGSITNVQTIQFDLTFEDGAAEGRMQWDIANQTVSFGMPGGRVNGQLFMEEFLPRVKADGILLNGTLVKLDSGAGDRPVVNVADPDSIATVGAIGMVTEDIDDNQFGYVTTRGLIRGEEEQPIDTSSWVPGTILFLDDDGGFTNVRPDAPRFSSFIGTVWRQHSTEGEIYLTIVVVPTLCGLSDVYCPTTPNNDEILGWDTPDARWEPRVAMVTIPTVLSSYTDLNLRNLDQFIHGGFDQVSTGEVISNGVPINVTVGLGKVVLSVIAGADTAGTITITGTSVDRNTGVETGADTDTLTIAGVTTDSSSTDVEGNTIHDLTNAYITAKWFKGAIVISTTDVNLSDVDVNVVAFEQFNDTPDLTLQTLDVTLVPTNANAWVYMYLYTVLVTDDTVIISNVATVALPSADSVADRFYRLREGLINEALDGTTDGVFLEIFLGPDPLQYISQMTIKIWADLELPVNLT